MDNNTPVLQLTMHNIPHLLLMEHNNSTRQEIHNNKIIKPIQLRSLPQNPLRSLLRSLKKKEGKLTTIKYT
jgi:hypothetical protein